MKKLTETMNRLPNGTTIARRSYDLDGIPRSYEWTDDGQGSVTLSVDGGEPATVAALFEGDTDAAPAPAILSKVAFMDMAYPLLGAGLAGVQRYGEVLTQAKASAAPLVVAAMERYTHASVFERDDVATFLDILVADPGVDLTSAERDAVVNGWPDETAA